MSEYPAFLFYPGDYLRDTQCLSEKTQVAYDRIMCEHKRFACEDMNLICLPQEKIDFFAKRLSEDEKYELMSVLIKKDAGIQIEWVAASISKTVKYNNSRAKNRKKKDKNISKHKKTHDPHKEIEDENENKNESENDLKLKEVWKIWIENKSSKKFKNQKAELIGFNKFLKLCNGNPDLGLEIVEQSISNCWAGLFQLKETIQTGSKKGKTQTAFDTAESVKQELKNNLNNQSNGITIPALEGATTSKRSND